MDLIKVKEVFSDQEFVKELFDLDEPLDVQKALREKDVEVSIEEIETMRDVIVRYQNDQLTDQEKKLLEMSEKNDDELSDDLLESVSGGSLTVATLFAIYCIGTALIVGSSTAGVVHLTTRGR